MFGIGTTELILILVILVMLFGVGKLPELASFLGSGVKNFQKGLRGEDEEEDDQEDDGPELLEEDKPVETSVNEETRETAKRSESY
ncbi:MAG: twin-arginine translocase TatA/TatE family subunit [Persicimonas sp.]